jgi:hypothetical protein
MKLSARTAALYSVTFAGLLMLSACGKNESQNAGQPAASSTAPTAAPAPASTAAKPAPASTAAKPAPTSTAAMPATPAPASTAPTTGAAAADAFKVDTVTLGDTVNAEHKVRKAMTSFSPDQKTLYASVDTLGSTNGSTLSAKWSYLEGKGQLVMDTSQLIAADGPATTTFKVENPNLWPEGKYEVDILLDGKQVASQSFEIKKR